MAVDIENVVILTGAGISAESGLQTFRGGDGLWCGHRIAEVATPEGYARNPQLVQDFYNARRRQLAEVTPNAAHHAIARLVKEWPGRLTLVTQNVDDLHGRALAGIVPRGNFEFIHMHGELMLARHVESGAIRACREDLTAEGDWRPHIVWFGEMPLEMERIDSALRQADLFVAIGTSGNVYPAAGFVQQALAVGADTLELNLEPSLVRSHFAQTRFGPATQLVPAWVEAMLS